MYRYDNKTWLDEADVLEAGLHPIAGVDEVGRGGLAGAVLVAAVSFPNGVSVKGLADSKKLSQKRREELYQEILEKALSVSFVAASNQKIDEVNIYQATKQCVISAIGNLSVEPAFVYVDGLFDFDPGYHIPITCVPGGDGAHIYDETGKKKKLVGHHFPSIAAASIVAKVTRDRMMVEYANIYPEYGFESNKGYGTKYHMDALAKYGPCDIHRMSFAPVAAARRG